MPPRVGGRLSLFSRSWELVTSDKWVLQTVSEGYRLEFTSSPPHHSKPIHTSLPADRAKRKALQQEVDQLLAKGAIEIVNPREIAFFSTFFLTTKKSGEWRPILNLKKLNKHIKPPPFKMESLAAILPELQRNWWGATLDLKDAYLHVPIEPSSRKWLGFAINNDHYRFKCLPFGLSTAPRTFTRIVKVIAEYLRTQGRYIFIYLDDWLLTAPSPDALRDQVKTTMQLVQSLGFIINLPKSAPEPSQRIQFLGAILDFKTASAFPSQERVQHITKCATEMLSEDSPPARLWLRLLGLIASTKHMLPQSILRMRRIQLHFLGVFRCHRDSPHRRIQKSKPVKAAITWWTHPLNILPGRKFVPQRPSFTLTTDASKSGWGAHWRDIHLSGTWSKTVARHHINLLELWAIHLALRKLRKHFKGKSVLIRCDNMSVVMYINKMGGVRSRSLCIQTVRLLQWCHRQEICLQAAHIAGVDNVLADALSRRTSSIQDKTKVRGSSVEWHLNQSVCKMLFNRLQRPLIDLFANNQNKQLPTFCSWSFDPMALAQDALTISWNRTLAYAFPPIAMIPRVLEKLTNSEACEIILIAPKWPRQPWFTRLLSLLAGTPIALPQRRDLIRTEEGTLLPIQTLKTLNLTAWTLSSDPTRRQDFLRRQPLSLERQGDLRQDRLITPASGNTCGGAKERRSILIEHL